MIRTKAALQKKLKGIETGTTVLYPSIKGDYALVNLTHSVIEWVDKSLIDKLRADGTIFPFLAYTLNYEQLKKKGGNVAS